MMRVHRLLRTGLLTLGVLTGGLLLAGTPALALVAHEYTGQRLTEAPPGTALQKPWGMAFDPLGNLFLADPGVPIVDQFNSEDAFAQQIGGGVLSGGYNRSVAVASTGDVYVMDAGKDYVVVFKPNGTGGYELLSEWKNPAFGGGNLYDYVAVDNSSSDERAGDVYVMAGSTVYVVKPKPPGPKEKEEGELLTGDELSVGGNGANDGLAVDSLTGDVYVAQPGNHAVAVFNDKGKAEPSLAPRGSETPTGSLGSPTAVAVDESTGAVYVLDEAGRVVDEFSSSGEYEGQIKGTAPESLSGPGSPFAAPLGVAVQPHEGLTPTKGDVYVSDGAAVDVFGPDVVGSAPAVSGEQASTETPFSEHLEGEVDPKGAETEFLFSYAKGSSCTGAGAVTTPIGHSAAKASESAVASALEPSTPYAFCMVVASKFGLVHGPSVGFPTAGSAPEAEAGSETTSEVRSGEATLQAKVNPENQQSGYYFEASTAALGACPVSPAQAGTVLPAVYEARGVSVSLSRLPPGTTYNYRVVAYDATGVSCGPVETFSTQPLLLGASTAGAVTQSTATITATIDPGGLETLYELDLGTSTAYGTTYPGDAGSGSTPTTVTFELTGLEPGTTYHYRLLAGNGKETEMGPDRTFTTAATTPGALSVFAVPLSPPLLSFTGPPFPAEAKGSTTPKALTKAQKLTAALKACKKKRSKSKRATCIKQAHKKYGPIKKKKK
jgi:hypothetical protein